MAKKKQKKNKDKKFEYSNEIVGLIIILISIIGIGGYGLVGNLIKSFAIFLVGTIYIGLLLVLLVFGVYLIFKREKPNLFTTKLLGLYAIILSLLIALHIKYVEVNGTQGFKIITETFDNLMLAFTSPNSIDNVGGGVIGAIFSWIFVSAFGDGAMIVVFTMALLGLILFLNHGLKDIIDKIKPVFKDVFAPREKDETDEEETKEDKSSKVKMNTLEEPPEEVIVKKPEIVKEEAKAISQDVDIPIAKVPPKIVAPNEENVKDEVIINSVNENYQLPPINLLKQVKSVSNKENENQAKQNITNLEKVLQDFDITGHIVQVNIGPTVTQYELELKAGTKVNRLLSIQREIALALAAKEIRIEAPIPGKNTIGIELPNKVLSSVSFISGRIRKRYYG